MRIGESCFFTWGMCESERGDGTGCQCRRVRGHEGKHRCWKCHQVVEQKYLTVKV